VDTVKNAIQQTLEAPIDANQERLGLETEAVQENLDHNQEWNEAETDTGTNVIEERVETLIDANQERLDAEIKAIQKNLDDNQEWSEAEMETFTNTIQEMAEMVVTYVSTPISNFIKIQHFRHETSGHTQPLNEAFILYTL
jgi:hypothetical protein